MIAQVDLEYLKRRPISALRRIVTRLCFEGRPLTTSHRWLNSIVFAHFAIEKHLSFWKSIKQPVFIVGSGRSGSTILATLLSFHPHVGLLNEPKAIWHTIHNYEDVNGNYTTTIPGRYRLYASDASQTVKQTAHRLFGAYATLTGSKRIVDKNSEMIFCIPFVQAIFPDAKFIFLVRNDWDTIHSIESWSLREAVHVNGQIHDWWGRNRRKWLIMVNELVNNNPLFVGKEAKIRDFIRPIDMAAVEWIVTMQAGIERYKQHPNNIYLLHFEDLIKNPNHSLAQILAFCNLPQDKELIQYAQTPLSPPSPYKLVELDNVIADLFRDQVETVAMLK